MIPFYITRTHETRFILGSLFGLHLLTENLSIRTCSAPMAIKQENHTETRSSLPPELILRHLKLVVSLLDTKQLPHPTPRNRPEHPPQHRHPKRTLRIP